MFSMLLKAAFKRGAEITQDRLVGSLQLVKEQVNFCIDQSHYEAYSRQLQWSENFVHPCYLQMVALPLQLSLLLDGLSPFKAMGLVHIHNKIEQSADFDATLPCDLHASFSQVMRHNKGVAADISLLARQRDKVVYCATATFLERRHISDSVALQSSQHLPYVTEASDADKEQHIAELVFSSSIGREYASLSGDYNPIHLATWTAKLLGFKRAIAHGMYSLAKVLAVAEHSAGIIKPGQNRVVECDFLKPIFLPGQASLYRHTHDGKDRLSLRHPHRQDIHHLSVRYSSGEASGLNSRL